jgi:hypothetical protein
MVNLKALTENFEAKSKRLLSEINIPEEADDMASLLRSQGDKIYSKQKAHMKKALKAANKKFGENLKMNDIVDQIGDTFELSGAWEDTAAIVAGDLDRYDGGRSSHADSVWEYVMYSLMENAYKILGKPNAKLREKFEDEGGDVEWMDEILFDEGGVDAVYPYP